MSDNEDVSGTGGGGDSSGASDTPDSLNVSSMRVSYAVWSYRVGPWKLSKDILGEGGCGSIRDKKKSRAVWALFQYCRVLLAALAENLPKY